MTITIEFVNQDDVPNVIEVFRGAPGPQGPPGSGTTFAGMVVPNGAAPLFDPDFAQTWLSAWLVAAGLSQGVADTAAAEVAAVLNNNQPATLQDLFDNVAVFIARFNYGIIALTNGLGDLSSAIDGKENTGVAAGLVDALAVAAASAYEEKGVAANLISQIDMPDGIVFFEAANEAAMTALTGVKVGDIAFRADEDWSLYMLAELPSSSANNWTRIRYGNGIIKPVMESIASNGTLLIGNGIGTVGVVDTPTTSGLGLTSDNSTKRAKWARFPSLSRAMVPVQIGEWWSQPHGSLSTQALTLNYMIYEPIWIPDDPTAIDGIAIEVTTPGASGIVKLGLYRPDVTTQKPDALAVAGQIDSSTAAVKELIVAATAVVPNSIAYIGIVAQVAACTVRRGATDGMVLHHFGYPSATSSEVFKSGYTTNYSQAGVSGDLPSTATPLPQSNVYGFTGQPIVALRRNA